MWKKVDVLEANVRYSLLIAKLLPWKNAFSHQILHFRGESVVLSW